MVLLCVVVSTTTAQTALQRLRRNILVIDSNHPKDSTQQHTMTRYLLDENIVASASSAHMAIEEMEMIERILGGDGGSLSMSL
jgi:hypothetical protein